MSTGALLPAAIVAFSITVSLIFALRPVAEVVGLIDRPGGRKVHESDTPVIGGIAIFAGVFASTLLLGISTYSMVPIFVACLLLVGIGIIDDRFHVRAPVRISAQIAATLIMVYGAGLMLTSIGKPFGTGEIGMGPFSLVFTVLVTLTMVNAYNLIDGLDGLAASLALIALLAIAIAGGLNHASAGIALVFCAAICGFLVFNLPAPWTRKIKVFMGDAGSTLIGFSIVWITLGICQGPDRVVSPVHCLWFASVPIYDFFTCFVRRMLKGKSPFTPGRDHFHHTLMRGGFGVRETLTVLIGLQAVYALLGIVGHFADVPDVVLFTTWSALGLSQRFVIRLIARRRRAFRIGRT